MFISDHDISEFIREDVPYIDLTTKLLEIEDQPGKMTFATREDTVLSGVEEVLEIFKKLDIKCNSFLPSGTFLEKDKVFIEAEGTAKGLHMAWRVSLSILEYFSGIATRTKVMVDKAKKVNPDIDIVTTRKVFPGTKKLSIKSIIAGGAWPHRLGLSETILIFQQHINFLGGYGELAKIIPEIKTVAFEKKVTVEVENMEDAILMTEAGVDTLQTDKLSVEDLTEVVEKVKSINPDICITAAGGINVNNVEAYAATGVDGIATTALYFGKPSDISVKIEPIQK
ncbi:MAG TPA: ModD protein [Clostridia bacterium]|nr:ModD protein [Clostridia bacterium]